MIRSVGVVPTVALLTLALASTAPARSEKPPDVATAKNPSDEEIRYAEFLLAGLKDSVEQVRSGELRIQEIEQYSPRQNKEQRHDVRVEVAYGLLFDYASGCVRFDTDFGSRSVRYSRNKLHSLYYDRKSRAVVKHHADHDYSIPESKPFDLRLIGLATEGEVRSRMSNDELWAFLDANKPVRALRESGTVSRIVFEYPMAGGKLTGRRTLWVSSAKGFLPERMECQYLLKKSDQWVVAATSAVDWQEVSGVWVPAKAVLADLSASSRTELSFTWESVNQPIDSSAFEVAGIGAPHGTSVWDVTLAEPILDSVVGQLEDAKPLAASYPWSRIVFLVANGVALAILFAALAWHRWRTREVKPKERPGPGAPASPVGPPTPA